MVSLTVGTIINHTNMSETNAETRLNSLYSLTREQRSRAAKRLEKGISRGNVPPAHKETTYALKSLFTDSLQYAQDSEEMRLSLQTFENIDGATTKLGVDYTMQQYSEFG